MSIQKQLLERNRRIEIEERIAGCQRSGSQMLDLAKLSLSSVPEAVRHLTHLHSLKLDGNKLAEIPAWIGELTELRELILYSNPLTALPPVIGQLHHLDTLVIDGATPEVAIPAIGQLASLRLLGLARMSLRTVPAWIQNLQNLNSLFLHGNPLTEIPDWFGELRDLRALYLEDTKLRALPASLRKLRNLERLSLQGIPSLRLPTEVLRSTPERILDYYFRTRDPSARQPLNEFKLILVGRGGVGKTTLVHRLVNQTYKTFRRTTGIQITQWPMAIDGEQVRAHIWDFGGQEIMHGTHRFFMTERALYLILLSGREGTEDQDAEYWLSLVRSFAGDVPVIVLLHKWSDYPFELNRALLQQKYGNISFLSTDSASDHGIATLRQQIARLASSLPGLKASWPAAWQQIKTDLPQQRRSWLTFKAFCKFCSERGVDSPGDQEALAGYLHDLGLMLSYRRDDTLRQFGVLNPQWATEGIYKMLNARGIRDANGQFTLRSFAEVLPVRAYPETLHPFLLALMSRFRLCHPLGTKGTRYLIPELLSKEEPALDEEFPPAECLNFVYQYTSVLPEGLLPRFIVESYVHREPRHAWRSGAVLERANCRAMVRGDLQARTVTIRVGGVGNGRRELLGIIREHFERIHASYEKLSVVTKVPIPGHPDALVDHDLLLTHEQEGEQEITVQVGRRLQRFDVIKLLDGVDLPGVVRPQATRSAGPEGVRVDLKQEISAWRDALDSQFDWSPPPPIWVAPSAFVAYARKDAAFLDQLRAALVPHERLGEVSLWCDALVEPGQVWEREILDHLERAQIVILLLSNDFLRSSYCMDQELPRALERQARGECEIVPILVRACRHDKLELGKIQTIRPGDKSIDEHDKKDPAWVVVTHEIDRVIERIKKRRRGKGASSNALLLAGSTAPT